MPTGTCAAWTPRCEEKNSLVIREGRSNEVRRSPTGRTGPRLKFSLTWAPPRVGWKTYGSAASQPAGRTATFWAPTTGPRPPARRDGYAKSKCTTSIWGIGYEPSDWPEEYVSWELPMVLGTVPDRVKDPQDMRHIVAWLSGRGPVPATIHLDPWS